jgi:hypothetical protein
MDTEDWLHIVECELHTAQCNDCEKVLYGPQQLREAALSWWESYLATHADPEAITWEEFMDNFRRYHVPEGLMIVRKEETVHVSTVGNKAIGRIIAQRKQLSSSQLSMTPSGRMHCNKEATAVGSLVPSMER